MDLTGLLIDDDEEARASLSQELQGHGIAIAQAIAYKMALEMCRQQRFDFVMIEVSVANADGIRYIRDVKAIQAQTRILATTVQADVSIAVLAMRAGAFDFIPKPISADQVLNALLCGEILIPQHRTLTLEEVRQHHICDVLRDTGHNVSESARRLGLRRQSLQRMLRKTPPPPREA